MRRKSWLGNLLFAGIILACMPADAKAQESPQPFPGGRETPFMKLWNPFKEAGIHGYAAFDYFSSDKALTKNQHFPGLNLVLQSEPSFGDHPNDNLLADPEFQVSGVDMDITFTQLQRNVLIKRLGPPVPIVRPHRMVQVLSHDH